MDPRDNPDLYTLRSNRGAATNRKSQAPISRSNNQKWIEFFFSQPDLATMAARMEVPLNGRNLLRQVDPLRVQDGFNKIRDSLMEAVEDGDVPILEEDLEFSRAVSELKTLMMGQTSRVLYPSPVLVVTLSEMRVALAKILGYVHEMFGFIQHDRRQGRERDPARDVLRNALVRECEQYLGGGWWRDLERRMAFDARNPGDEDLDHFAMSAFNQMECFRRHGAIRRQLENLIRRLRQFNSGSGTMNPTTGPRRRRKRRRVDYYY